MFAHAAAIFTTLATATAGATTTAPLASACTNTHATSICIDPATGDLVQLNGHAMLSGSGTVLQDCALDSSARHPSQIHRLADGGLRVTRAFVCAPNAHHDAPARAKAIVVDTFTPAIDGTILWNVSVAGRADAASRWSTGIQTALGYRDWDTKQGTKAWVGGPHIAELPSATFDPLAPFVVDQPAASYGDFFYGTGHSDIARPGVRGGGDTGKATHLPVLERVDGANSTAVVQSLDYVPIVSITNMGVASSTHGGVWLNYTRLYERLGGATPALAFTQHVLAVPTDDWRPTAAFLNAQYPEYFEPNPEAHALDWEGTGSYGDLRGPADFPAADAPHYAAMGYKLNWDSSARFPWHGDWVPTDADGFNGKNWTSCFTHDAPDGHLNENCSTFSYAEISGWYAHQRSLGFRTCNYANLFQFGWNTAEVWATDTTGGGRQTRASTAPRRRRAAPPKRSSSRSCCATRSGCSRRACPAATAPRCSCTPRLPAPTRNPLLRPRGSRAWACRARAGWTRTRTCRTSRTCSTWRARGLRARIRPACVLTARTGLHS